jgi:hypothetical protein
MVADDNGYVAGQLLGPLSDEQVKQAVVHFADQDGHALFLGGVGHPPIHAVASCQVGDGCFKHGCVAGADGQPAVVKHDALEEPGALVNILVCELVGLEDVAVESKQQLR